MVSFGAYEVSPQPVRCLIFVHLLLGLSKERGFPSHFKTIIGIIIKFALDFRRAALDLLTIGIGDSLIRKPELRGRIISRVVLFISDLVI